jgi:hypothetical protein
MNDCVGTDMTGIGPTQTFDDLQATPKSLTAISPVEPPEPTGIEPGQPGQRSSATRQNLCAEALQDIAQRQPGPVREQLARNSDTRQRAAECRSDPPQQFRLKIPQV